MSSDNEETLYEIALAIGQGETVAETVRESVAGYLSALDCSVGAVLEGHETATGCEYELAATIPSDADDHPALQAASASLSQRAADDARDSNDPLQKSDSDDEVHNQLLHTGETANGDHYHIFSLPDFGVLVLVADDPLDSGLLTALAPLNEKLAEACQNSRNEQELREQRNRFEAVFDAIQEPVVNVVFEDDQPIVTRVNEAFEETFGYDAETVRGEDPNDFILPDDDSIETTARQIDQSAVEGETVTREVRRQTGDGIGYFLFRSAPVDTPETDEHVGMYVDITDEKVRQHKLETLYSKTERILAGESRATICERTVWAADDIIDCAFAGLFLYDRQQESLVSASIRADAETFAGEQIVAEQETKLWEVYETGEPVQTADTTNGELLPWLETASNDTIILPLGEYGVFAVATTGDDTFDAADFQFARLLSTPVEIALGRTQREQGLERTQEITRAMLAADSHEEVAETLLSHISELLDMPISGVWRYNAGKNALEPIASTERARELFGQQPTFTSDDSIAWKAFQSGTTEVVADVAARADTYNDESIINSEVITPLGEFGILITGSMRKASFTEAERHVLETLAPSVETAMRLVSQRQELDLLDQVLARILRHNLRNDLTVIQGFANTIRNQSDGDIAAQATRIVDRSTDLITTAAHAREMREVVRKRDETITVNLHDAVEHAIQTVRDDYPDAKIVVSFEATPTVSAHPDLATAIRHLIENGIVHADCPEGDVPCVTVSVYRSDGSPVIEVHDNGPGIPSNELETLRQHGESALEHGSGAGLWIIDRVIDYSNATISFDTTDGTTASIRFES